jgi:D-methionine transport system ATP-binding protein
VDRPVIEHRIQIGMEQLHLPSDWLDRTEAQLSVGQRQLVAIARALIIQPKVLLLDEPTSALDAGRGEHLLSVLQALTQVTSTTILMVSHNLELMQQFCNQLLYLRQGQLIQNLSVNQVNWSTLKQTLIDEETEAAEEWA